MIEGGSSSAFRFTRAVAVGNEYAVLEAAMKFAQPAGNNNVLPTPPGTWIWDASAYSKAVWHVKHPV